MTDQPSTQEEGSAVNDEPLALTILRAAATYYDEHDEHEDSAVRALSVLLEQLEMEEEAHDAHHSEETR